ncbi:low temperature requirement protein A [Pararobbsia silviterrae]|uniref:Low temperature requirement protein A n=1 Tax=Pararobbsia silviterrae TaxID=1792498 RepID=A0A494Y7P0_9BURK|nr:low temperature requirement protein A [Pararobbsia silviterrae]RKP58712.1 low temperature requirement protein A [Pararobbsia silviterrae]
MPESLRRPARYLRERTGEEARVTNVELFFDLVYAFAVTQLSHKLAGDLTLLGGLQTIVLWFAVWLGWQYTCWVTNWFDPDRLPVRVLLLAIMLIGTVMSASLPLAFDDRGLTFALCYVVMQVGRSLVAVRFLGHGHALSDNFKRITGWLSISGVLWIAGALVEGPARLALWLAAVVCEYVSPMFGFALPGLGRSRSSDWQSAEGSHIAERCQAFVIIVLGESLLSTGGTLSETRQWDAPGIIAFLVCFLGTVALWWIYFDTSSRAGSERIARAERPGQMAAYFHYVHAILVAGVIGVAAGDDLVIEHPDERIRFATACVLVGAPMVYVFGNALYKRIVYGAFPLSHLVGIGLLLLLFPFAFETDRLMVAGLTTLILIVVAAWESVSRRRGAEPEIGSEVASETRTPAR